MPSNDPTMGPRISADETVENMIVQAIDAINFLITSLITSLPMVTINKLIQAEQLYHNQVTAKINPLNNVDIIAIFLG